MLNGGSANASWTVLGVHLRQTTDTIAIVDLIELQRHGAHPYVEWNSDQRLFMLSHHSEAGKWLKKLGH